MSMDTDAREYRSPAATATARVISRYESDYFRQEGVARQALARMRRGVAGDIANSPETWPYVFQALADRDNDAGPTSVERSVHAAIVLWAKHQQSRSTAVNASGVSLGQATGILSSKLKRDAEVIDAGVHRHFTRVTTAPTFEARMRALTQLVSLLRANDVGLDYPRLAADLVAVQDPYRRQTVLVRWVRDLHRSPRTTDQNTAAPTAENQE